MGTVAPNKKGVTPHVGTMNINTWIRKIGQSAGWILNPRQKRGQTLKKTGDWYTPPHCTFHLYPPVSGDLLQ